MSEDVVSEPSVCTRQPNQIVRRARIKPGMCGPNSLFVGQVGDWTWDAVSQFCGTDVYNARNEQGSPTYLGFYYYHIKASPDFHPGTLTFGDMLQVDSNVFGFGSESVLTLHLISRASEGTLYAEPLDLDTFYQRTPDNCMFIQNFNRWLVRTEGGSNEKLQKSSPVDFVSEHLPQLPARYSPRLVYDYARRNGSFLTEEQKAQLQCVAQERFEYQVDITRDLNGVGLLYFASYFTIVDQAILRLWRKMAWEDQSFMDRAVLDHQICFMGNANMSAVLMLEAQLWVDPGNPHAQKIFNVVIFEKSADRMMAVATVQL
ncbi:LnmK family bifunctional acyltransferase/decarboxylase [Pseudomonas sp. H3(2019)]|uniref:LnmK family bifunctional acyltransferase/decarboxylase n=1 Tax=Pseudomonas sp. H3(2019) TaxID=2598724 RepID=UPI001191FDBC|nr:LnmK family bifunctional acyltransferase/decarboxylase [Pseudomonas sp. H3(2019)]TVT86073.1 biosynthesis cluster domain-containing protein [Pseudomonas sp. H3(2019)]